MRISDWSSDVCSSDLLLVEIEARTGFSFQQGGWLADVAPTNLDADLRARIAAAKAYATERRQSEAKIPQEFLRAPKGSAWPTHMPSFETANAIAEARRLKPGWTGRNVPFNNVAQNNEQFPRPLVVVSHHFALASQLFNFIQ